MTMLPADWLLAALVLTTAVTGLFRGFSGTLAFVVAAVVAGVAAVQTWEASAAWLGAAWMRGGATLVAALLVFGLVRLVIKRTVNGLLAQPTDALFGFLVGAVAGGLVILAWAKSGLYLEYSSLATEVAAHVW